MRVSQNEEYLKNRLAGQKFVNLSRGDFLNTGIFRTIMLGNRDKKLIRELGYRPEWLDYKFTNTNVDIIYQFASKAVIPITEPYWNDMVAHSCRHMITYGFDQQPSVNIRDTTDRTSLDAQISEEILMLERVSLLEHTTRVVVELKKHFDANVSEYTAYEKLVMLLSCLYHDFGKSVNLMKAYGVAEDVDKIRIMTHARASAEYIDKMFDERFHSDINKYSMNVLLFEVMWVVRNHHNKEPDVERKALDVLRLMDKRAREIEINEIKTYDSGGRNGR